MDPVQAFLCWKVCHHSRLTDLMWHYFPARKLLWGGLPSDVECCDDALLLWFNDLMRGVRGSCLERVDAAHRKMVVLS